MGLCPIAPPKGFPFSIVCFCHRQQQPKTSLETFGCKYFILFLKYWCCYLDNPGLFAKTKRPELQGRFRLRSGLYVCVCRLYGLRAYTTLCKPSVFSISSITPSVATIIMVASAAMVGSK